MLTQKKNNNLNMICKFKLHTLRIFFQNGGLKITKKMKMGASTLSPSDGFPYKTNNLIPFSEKTEHVSIF